MKLNGKRVLLTGGSLGIGRQLAKDLVAEGARVLACARNIEALRELKNQNREIDIAVCDVRDQKSVQELHAELQARFGGLDVLINNAAVFRRLDLLHPSGNVEDWIEEVEINLAGTLRVTHAFLPLLKAAPSGTVINLTSPSAYIPLAAAPVYSATKAAMHSWTVSLRHQLRTTSIRVVELNPPAVDTRMNENNPSVADLKLWSVSDFSSRVVGELQKHAKNEVLVGDAKLVRIMSRLAPGFVFRKMNPN